MENRLYVAFGLSIVVILVFYVLLPPTKAPPPPAKQEAQSQPGQPPADGAAPAVPAAAAPAGRPARPAAAPDRRITVEAPLYRAVLDTRGGRLLSLQLKEYKAHKDSIDWGDVLPFLRSLLPKQRMDQAMLVEMVRHRLPDEDMLGVGFSGQPALTQAFRNVVFASTQDSLSVPPDKPGTLILTGAGPGGVTVQKELTFHPDSYLIGYTVRAINYGAAAQSFRMVNRFGEGPDTSDGEQRRGGHEGPMYRQDGKIHKPDSGDVGDLLAVKDPQWLGITDVYFISAARAKSPMDHGFYVAQPLSDKDPKQRGTAYGFELPAVQLEPQKMISGEFELYLGPKSTDDLEKFGQGLEYSLDLTLNFLAMPLLALLRWLHGFARNYGLSIILLTLIVRMVLFPLTYRGMVSMKRMQKLQPKMASLREKFKNDRERMNRETMEMYRRYKVNPLGGCLPIVLQIPVFFALYSALLGAIELRHSPFMLWITDLSAYDGLFIGPLLMGGSMFFQQKLTPTSLDPVQAKVMLWMPVIFTAFMFTFPSGLVVYWFTSNLLSIAQQLIINRVKVPDFAET